MRFSARVNGSRGVRWIAAMTLCCATFTKGAAAQEAMPAPTDSAGFAEYSAAACVAAVDRVQLLSWRAKVDTTSEAKTARTDTLTTAAVQAARACVAHLSMDGLPHPRDLVFLARVYLAAGSDELAHRAIQRRLSLDAGQPVTVRGETLKDIIMAYANARPMRYPEIKEYWDRLVQWGPEVVPAQMSAGILTAYYLQEQRNYPLAAQYASDILRLLKTVPPAVMARHQNDITVSAALASALVVGAAEVAGGPDSAKAVVAQLRSEAQAMGIGEQAAPVMHEMDEFYKLYGSPAPLLQGTLWYGTTQTQRPTQGKVSIILLHAERSVMPMLRRLKGKYGDRLEITIVDATRGYYMNAGPLSPKEEADTLAYFYRTVLDAPAAVVVNEAPVRRKPDGRLVRGLTENQNAYRGGQLFIVDQQQRIQFVSRSFAVDEKRVVAVLQQLLEGKGGAEPATSSIP